MKTKKKRGGKVFASGGYGCVFTPALKCQNEEKRKPKQISKLMTNRHAIEEYEKINTIKQKLETIPNYKDFFVIYNISICHPSKLTTSDLTAFTDKCSALPKNNITKSNINTKLDQIMALNLPNAGLPVDDYIYLKGNYVNVYKTHLAMFHLLKNGILPMNQHHIYHSDIKDSNILMEETNGDGLKARLIDWGLTVEYNPHATNSEFPKNWKNRPLQFNVPFSIIIFTDLFYTKYTNYLREGGQVNESDLKLFVLNYLTEWTKERGSGHYKFINEIIYLLYNHTLTAIPKEKKPTIIETQITMPCIINYIVDVLLHYTKFKEDGSLNLREYLNEVFIKIIDIWGYITAYYPLLEILSNNYNKLNIQEMKLFRYLQYLFHQYMLMPRHTHIQLPLLYKDLNQLGKLINSTKYETNSYASGIKTRKNTFRKSSLFKKKKLVKKFKHPFLLS
jgi:serine/threonine protein kinase